MCYRLAAFRSQCQWTPHPLPPLWRWGLNLDLNSIERVIYLRIPENYSFESSISYYFLQVAIYHSPTFTGARGAHKQHHGYIYSYHQVIFCKNSCKRLTLV